MAGPPIPLNGESPVNKWLPEACNADFLLAQETHLPNDAVAPALFRLPQHREWVSTNQTARKGSAGGSWLQRRCGMAWLRRHG